MSEFNKSLSVGHSNQIKNFIGASVLKAGFTFPKLQT